MENQGLPDRRDFLKTAGAIAASAASGNIANATKLLEAATAAGATPIPTSTPGLMNAAAEALSGVWLAAHPVEPRERHHASFSSAEHTNQFLEDLPKLIETLYARASRVSACFDRLRAVKDEASDLLAKAGADLRRLNEERDVEDLRETARDIRQWIADPGTPAWRKIFDLKKSLPPKSDISRKNVDRLPEWTDEEFQEWFDHYVSPFDTAITDWNKPTADKQQRAEEILAEIDRKLEAFEARLSGAPHEEALALLADTEEGKFIELLRVFIMFKVEGPPWEEPEKKRLEQFDARIGPAYGLSEHTINDFTRNFTVQLPWNEEETINLSWDQSPSEIREKLERAVRAIPKFYGEELEKEVHFLTSGTREDGSSGLIECTEENAAINAARAKVRTALPSLVERLILKMGAKYFPDTLAKSEEAAKKKPAGKHSEQELARRDAGVGEEDPRWPGIESGRGNDWY